MIYTAHYAPNFLRALDSKSPSQMWDPGSNFNSADTALCIQLVHIFHADSLRRWTRMGTGGTCSLAVPGISKPAPGPLMKIKVVVRDLTSRPKVGRYSEAVLVTCIAILRCTYRFGNQTAVLHYELKKEPLKKHLTKSVGGQSVLVALVGLRWASHLPTLWYSSQSANFQSFLRAAQVLIENGFSFFVEIQFSVLLPWALFRKFLVEVTLPNENLENCCCQTFHCKMTSKIQA